VHNVSIHQAAAEDGLAVVSNLLDSGLDSNGRDQSLYTALYWAIRNNSSKMVQLLLSRQADASLRDNQTLDDPNGFAPIEGLHQSVIDSSAEHVRLEIVMRCIE
jgi:ankyrin repeat protein